MLLRGRVRRLPTQARRQLIPCAGLDVDRQEAKAAGFRAEGAQRLAYLTASIQRGSEIQITITRSKQSGASCPAQLDLRVGVGVYATPTGDDHEIVTLFLYFLEVLRSEFTGRPRDVNSSRDNSLRRLPGF